MMKRLIRKAMNNWTPQIGDNVKWKRSQYDESVYEITQILENGNLFIDNGLQSYTDVKSNSVEPV